MALAGGIIVLLAVQRSRSMRPAVVRLDRPDGEISRQAVGVSEGFEFIENVAGKTLFILNAERTLGLSSGWTRIEKVRFRWFGQGDRQVELSCDTARFNPQTRDVKLQGAVHIRLPEGAFLDTTRGHFDASTQSFSSADRVVFSDGKTVGEAGSVVYRLSAMRLTLGGGVVIRQEEGSFLRAPRVRYDRRAGKVTFPDGLQMTGPTMRISAPHAVLSLDEQDKTLRKILLDRGVRVQSEVLEDGGNFVFWAERLRATRSEGRRWQVLATTSGPWVELDLNGTRDAELRRLQTWRLRAVVGEDGPIKAVFESRLCVEDIPREASRRWASAKGGQLWFENGRPVSFEMSKEVWLRSEGYTITADTARFLANDQRVVFGSDPAQRHRAMVRARGLQVSAERVEGFRAAGMFQAEGEVQGVVKDGFLLGKARSENTGGPIRFACDRLEVKEKGAWAVLRGGARLWQAERLLLADKVVMRRGGDELEAAGNVRVTMAAVQFNPDAPGGKEALIVAQSLVYDRGAGIISIKGDVRYSDPLYLMSCSELEAKLGEKNRVEVIDAKGAVDIQDLTEGRHMQGEAAHYTEKTHLLKMSGHPVRLLDSKNNLITGSSLTWDRAAGTVSVSGGGGTPTETIYHTEEIH